MMRMHKNPVWLAFLIVISLVVAWYCGVAIYKLYRYSVLTAQASSTNIQWKVQELSDEEYIIHARYSFIVEGKSYVGETDFHDKVFLNAWAAEQELKNYTDKPWHAWYQPGNP